jgi:hypothetical protein
VLIGLLCAKGAPGVTTSSLAIAAQWPRPAVVMDADPSGGDVAAGLGRGGLPAGCHLLELVARCRTQPLEAALRALVVRPGAHAPLVLSGLGSPAQAAAVPWATLGRGLARLDTVDVVCDLGRYLHGGGNHDLAEVCDRILVVTRSTLPAVRATVRLVDLLHVGRLGSRTGLLLVAPGRPYPADEVAAACETPLVGVLPDDPRAATVWSDGAAAGRSLSRSPLQRAARHIAETLDGPEMSAATMPAMPGQAAS